MACPHIPTPDIEIRIDRIERVIRERLGHPFQAALPSAPLSEPPSAEPTLLSSDLLARLRASLSSLERAGATIGAIPQGYPLWATLIIRAVSALLPWYTRSLHAYSRASTEAIAATLALLEDADRRSRESVR